MKPVAMLLTVLMSAAAQEQPRQIWDDYFGGARPAAPVGARQQKPQYEQIQDSSRVAPKPRSHPAPAKSTALGITIWKLEPSAKTDGARLLVQDSGGPTSTLQLTPHRVQANEPLKLGDRVRLSIEAPSSGYIYVVDQEVYSGAKLGPPYLIFPTTRTRGGDNRIRPGQLIEIPAQTDRENVFTLKAKGPEDLGEKLTIILSPQPLQDFKLADQEQELPSAQFASWLARWGSDSQQFELNGGVGRPWTAAEKEAGGNQSRLLTQEDPAPETVFVFPEKAGKPVVASIRLGLTGTPR